MLAGGYLFTGFMAGTHMLTFPGLFAPTGLLGAGDQTTAWLFVFWHSGFPLAVAAYALLRAKSRAPGPIPGGGIHALEHGRGGLVTPFPAVSLRPSAPG